MELSPVELSPVPDPDAVSYSRDIRPLFTDLDVTHMREFGIFLDDYAFMSVPVNAESAYFQVSHRLMPPAGQRGGRLAHRAHPPAAGLDRRRAAALRAAGPAHGPAHTPKGRRSRAVGAAALRTRLLTAAAGVT
ncbi:hypothetical protein GCM10020000_44150 [Streptomyces olivoverticillatus]